MHYFKLSTKRKPDLHLEEGEIAEHEGMPTDLLNQSYGGIDI